MTAYYNEIDPYAAQWLRNLIAAGHIADGIVDERSITDVRADELREFTQCHFFAGIGGWSLALRLAGWSDTRPVWTGSCPCQPFSAAGKRQGIADERHLWPDFMRLIAACKPPVVFGEQVESAIRHGWLDGVFADLEAEGYACGAAVLGAHSVGAPHIRQRLFWVGHADDEGSQGRCERGDRAGELPARSSGMEHGRLEHSESDGRIERRPESGRRSIVSGCILGRMGDPTGEQMGLPRLARRQSDAGFWDDYELIPCADGKARRIEPGTFPLAHGVPARVGKLRAYGNAIVPQVAQAFITAAMRESCI